MCDCKVFGKFVKTTYPGANKEQVCKDCGIGKVYWSGLTLLKIEKNNG